MERTARFTERAVKGSNNTETFKREGIIEYFKQLSTLYANIIRNFKLRHPRCVYNK